MNLRLLLCLSLAAAVGSLGSCKRSEHQPEPKQRAASSTAPESTAQKLAAYDPLAHARATGRQLRNPEAAIPPQCYTKTEGRYNPCWTCHTSASSATGKNDAELQGEYSFSDVALTNHWQNLFVDRTQGQAQLTDAAVLDYVRTDNYDELRRALANAEPYRGYRPDLDFALGFDHEGFAADASGWRALRYKPFPGVFWPTNGSTDDVMIRLPAPFRSQDGREDRVVYKANLAILEASFTSDPALADRDVVAAVEAIDESHINADLDRDGKLGRATRIVGLPAHFFGDARAITVRRNSFPKGTEFLHSVRYLDPDAPSMIARRMKELRYSRKYNEFADWEIRRHHAREAEEKDEGKVPVYQGQGDVALFSRLGWMFQGFIEDAGGRLRAQTFEEHLPCMGCHAGIAAPVDQTFAFARKLPGSEGFRYQDLRQVPDAPQLGHKEPEFLTYLRRAGASDEYRSNNEALERFAPNGRIQVSELLRAAPGGDRDVTSLIFPSRQRALQLNKAYMSLVREQRFDLGRDPVLAPATNVHRTIESEATGLAEKNKIYRDGQIRLDWSKRPLVMR